MPVPSVDSSIDNFVKMGTGYCAGGSGRGAVSAEEYGVTAKLGQERTPWHCPELHQMIVSAALDGARAMAAFQDGFLSSVGFNAASPPTALRKGIPCVASLAAQAQNNRLYQSA